MSSQEPAPISKVSDELTLAWAAGLFEGEGFLVRRKVRERVYLQLGIEMRDLDVMERFVAALVQHGLEREDRTSGPQKMAAINKRGARKHHNPRHSAIYRWATTGNTARSAYLLMRPYLGERRTLKGDSIVAEADEVAAQVAAARICEHCGAKFEPTRYGRHQRYCSRQCYDRWKAKQPGEREAARERNRRFRLRRRSQAGQQALL